MVGTLRTSFRRGFASPHPQDRVNVSGYPLRANQPLQSRSTHGTQEQCAGLPAPTQGPRPRNSRLGRLSFLRKRASRLRPMPPRRRWAGLRPRPPISRPDLESRKRARGAPRSGGSSLCLPGFLGHQQSFIKLTGHHPPSAPPGRLPSRRRPLWCCPGGAAKGDARREPGAGSCHRSACARTTSVGEGDGRAPCHPFPWWSW